MIENVVCCITWNVGIRITSSMCIRCSKMWTDYRRESQLYGGCNCSSIRTPFSHYLRSTLPTETLMCQDFRNQRLFFLRRLKRFGMVWEQLQAWPQSPAESHQSCSAHHRVSIAIHAGPLYPEEHEESWRNHKGPQPHQLHTFLLLPSGKLYRARSSRLRDIFYPQAVRLLNSGTLWKYFLSYTHTLFSSRYYLYF